LSLSEAEQRLKDRRLVSRVKWEKSSREKGTVLKQDPEAGFRVLAYSQVNLVVADGGGGIIWMIMGAIALVLAGAYAAYKINDSRRQPNLPKFRVSPGEPRPGRVSLSDVPSLVDCEIRLRGVQEPGTQEIEVEGPLISREEREHE
jgi:hypothetical protein